MGFIHFNFSIADTGMRAGQCQHGGRVAGGAGAVRVHVGAAAELGLMLGIFWRWNQPRKSGIQSGHRLEHRLPRLPPRLVLQHREAVGHAVERRGQPPDRVGAAGARTRGDFPFRAGGPVPAALPGGFMWP